MQYLTSIIFLFFYYQLHASTTLQIFDKDNKPLRDAVITFYSDKTHETSTHVISQKKYSFTPNVSIINIGDTVLFPNKDKVLHHFYSFSRTGIFEFYIDRGENKQAFVFDKEGIAILGCNIHDDMSAYIHILKNQSSLITNKKGKVTFEKNLPKDIFIWHKNQMGKKDVTQKIKTLKESSNWVAYTNISNVKERKKIKSGRY